MEDRRTWRKYNEEQYLAALEVELSVGNRFFYCTSVPRHQVKELVAMWKKRIMEMQDGESACIVLGWSGIADETMCFPTLKALKVIKQKGRVTFYTILALDPLLGNDEDWLWVFSDSDGSDFSRIWNTDKRIAEYSLQEFINLPIYTGSL